MRLCTPLPCDKADDTKHASQDRRESCGRCPRMLRTAPGDAKQETGGAADKQEQRSQKTQEAEREVDVEAPAPGRALHKGTTDHWPDNATNGPRGEHHGEVLGPLS